jgi:leader peptidase (prepilin peptidase)/N-methyltransferase
MMVLPPLYFAIMLFCFGAVVGSFLNVCIYRLPRDESLVTPPSHCPHCGQGVAWHDNVPILGWLWLRGRCRHCRNPISIQYPLVELITALATLWVGSQLGPTLPMAAVLLLTFAFIVMTGIDLYYYILPDVITLPGVALGLIWTGAAQLGAPIGGSPLATFPDAFIGALAGGGGLFAFAWLFKRMTGKDGMGMGDVKLLAMIGAWLGWQALPYTLFLAALLGSVAGITWILVSGRDRSLPIPFGPYLIFGGWTYIFWGPAVYGWYLRWAFGL